jgi:four helix bundle protein
MIVMDETGKSKEINQTSKTILNPDLKIRCYNFSVAIIRFVYRLQVRRLHYSIIDQLIRSSTSIGANIIEAKSASSKKDFIRFYVYALKSANETKYWLALLRDSLEVERGIMHTHLQEVTELSSIIAACILKLMRRAV